jgi:hypothetical protein
LWSGYDAGDVGVFFAFGPGIGSALYLGGGAAFVFLFALFLPGALFSALLERWSGSICHSASFSPQAFTRNLPLPHTIRLARRPFPELLPANDVAATGCSV